MAEEILAQQLRNEGISFTREAKLIEHRRWRWDFLIEGWLAVEVQGGGRMYGRHHRPEGYQNDCDKHNAAMLAGFAALQFTTDDVMKNRCMETILAALQRPETKQKR